MATQALSKSLKYIINAIIQTQCVFVLPHHHSQRYKCNPSTNNQDSRFPGASTAKTFTDRYEVTAIELAAYRAYIRKMRMIIMALQKYTFVDMHGATQHLVRPIVLKKEGKNRRSSVYKSKAQEQMALTVTIAVWNLWGSIMATHE